MQVSVEKTSELSRKMTVTVPEDVVQEKMEDRLKKLAREVKLDGFRPGKVPQHVVKKIFGERVRGEVTGDLIQSTYFEAIQENNLRPAGYPSIDPLNNSEGFGYTAVFEVYPEISLEGINQLQIIKKVAKVEESNLDEMVEKIRKQKKNWVQVERPSQAEDRVIISFSGISEGENFTNGKVENFQVEIGANQMIPGFEDNLKELSAGDSKTFEVNFPEQYGNAKLAGKVATFEIEVAKVEEPTYPEIDAEFIKSYGIEDGDINAFREDVKANMERELAMAQSGQLKNAVMEALFDKIKVSLPNSLVDEEINNLMKPYQENAREQKLNIEDLNLPRNAFEEQAKRRVALGLILAEIIHKHDIKVSAAKVREIIEEMAKSYERPAEVVNWYYSDEKRLNEVRQMALEDQTVEWIVSQAKVVEENVSFDAIMASQQS